MLVRKRMVKGSLKWVIELNAADGLDRRRRIVAAIQNKSAATAEGQRLLQQLLQGESLPQEPQEEVQVGRSSRAPTRREDRPFADAVAHFETYALPRLKASTRRGYMGILAGPGYRYWDGCLLSEITFKRVAAWQAELDARGLAPATSRQHLALLRSILNSVAPQGHEPGEMLDVMPSLPVLPRVGKQAVQAIDPSDVAKLLEGCKGRKDGLELAIALGYYAGLRASEIRALKSSDVDLRRNVIVVRSALCSGELSDTKSHDQRLVPISPPLLELLQPRLKALKGEDDYISVNAVGGPWEDSGIYHRLVSLCRRVGVVASRPVHGLRHGFATQLFASGKTDAITVQHLLGHADLTTTQRYAHHSEERARAAVAAAFG